MKLTTQVVVLSANMLLLGTIGASVAQHPHKILKSSSYARAVAAAKRAGFPVTAMDLQAPLPPPDQNAAPIYTRLERLLKTKPLSEADKVADYEGYNPNSPHATRVERMQDLRLALTDREDVVTLIHQAAARPKCVFVRNWSAAFRMEEFIPDHALFRSAARWLFSESALMLDEGKLLEAVRNQALGFHIARHVATDPTISSLLTGINVDEITLSGMERILYEAGDDTSVDEAVQRALETDRSHLSLQHALYGEIGIDLIERENERKAGPKGVSAMFGNEAAPGKNRPLSAKEIKAFYHFLDANGLTILTGARKAVPAAALPYPEARHVLHSVAAEIQRQENSPDYMLASMIFPTWESLLVPLTRDEARAAIVRCATALLAWEAQHEASPQTLAQAIEPAPTDPFDGKPLRYRCEGNGFVVYSVGPTGKFDGGSPHQKPPNGEVAFRYPRPAYVDPSP